jgi:hypothetical protein
MIIFIYLFFNKSVSHQIFFLYRKWINEKNIQIDIEFSGNFGDLKIPIGRNLNSNRQFFHKVIISIKKQSINHYIVSR